MRRRDIAARPAARAVGLLVCLATTLLAPPVFAQEQPASTAPAATAAPSWTVTCTSTGTEAELACSLSQVIVVKDSGQRVLTVTIGKDAGKLMLKLSLPHGLSLQKGVSLWIDQGERQNHPIVTADQRGSYALVPLDDPMIGALRKGTEMNVSVTAAAGSELVIKVSLKGFSAAFAKL